MLPLQLNEHAIGIILKELVRRATDTIQKERLIFVATPKAGKSGTMDDVFTTADTKAQEIFERSVKETMPGVGIIGEEDLFVPCTIPGRSIYVAIDPLDGTKAFVRRQLSGSATMVALMVDNEIASAWIGDINSPTIFGYRPNGTHVHRITDLNASEYLDEIDRAVDLQRQYLLLREVPEQLHPNVPELVTRFRKPIIDGSSIGIWFSRLWIGEVAGLVFDCGVQTPWDTWPTIGISQRLGFVFLRPKDESWEVYEPLISTREYNLNHCSLVVHESAVDQIIRS